MRRSMEENKQHEEARASRTQSIRMASENEGSEEYMVSTTQSIRMASENEGSVSMTQISCAMASESESEGSETGITRQMSNLMSYTSIPLFSYTDIKCATNYFSEYYRMGSWRYGICYKGYLDDGTEISIKMLDPKLPQDEADFIQELNVLDDLRHPNLAELAGACIEHGVHAVLYKFPADENLELFLKKRRWLLTWQIRTSIIHQICSALIFLYSNKQQPIIHGHLIPAYIRIDANFNCRVWIPEGTATSNPNPVGRFTEYTETGNRKLADDVYSLGIMVLRLLTGLPAATIEGQAYGASFGASLVVWSMAKVDQRAGNWPSEVAEELAYFGAKCCYSSKSNLLRREDVKKELGNFLVTMDNFKNKEVYEVSRTQSIRTASENEGSDEYMVSATQSIRMASENEGSVSMTQISCAMASESEGSETGITRQMSNLMSYTSIPLFSYTDIKRATKYLRESWRYGICYEGYLADCTGWVRTVMLDPNLPQDEADFIQELNVLDDLRHPNLAELAGACIEHGRHAVLYKSPPYGNLEHLLEERPWFLTWQIRTSIIHQICSALIFLYSNKQQPIIHGHLTPANILLDRNFNCTVSIPDQGTATSNPNPVGRFTEYIETGNRKLGDDRYSLGIIVLRLLTGLSAATIEGQAHRARIVEWTMAKVDQRPGNWPSEVAEELAYFGAKCCYSSKSNLLRMEDVKKELGNFLVTMDNFKNKENGGEDERAAEEASVSEARLYEKKKSTITLFDDDEIYAATDSLSDSCKIGHGSVYRAYLDDTEVTIKVLDANSQQGLDDFHREMVVAGQIRHPNLVKLIGTCFKLRSIVYELPANGNVENCLQRNPRLLTWQIRTRIAYEICSALTFFHSKKPHPMVHGNINPANIFLDSNFNSKLGDFDLSSFLSERTMEHAFHQTTPQGTLRYISPEYLETGLLTTSCDLYSYGVTILKLLTGKDELGIGTKVRNAYKSNSLMTIVDHTAGNWPPDVSNLLAYFSLKCYYNKRYRTGIMKQIKEKLGKLLDLLAEADNFKEGVVYSDYKLDSKSIRAETSGTTSEDNNSHILSSTSTSNVKVFSYSDIQRATNGLSEASKIGKGAYGSVYKGSLHNTEVAIKMLDVGSTQGQEEFIQELDVLGQMRHPSLVKLIGACFKHRSLVYEFVPNGSLEDCLKNTPTLLTWQMRTRMVYQICLALIYLHSNKPQPLLHGDLKPANILLDANYNIKLADFGLCRFLPEGTDTIKFHKTDDIKGTLWFINPDYLETGNINTGCDVYSFGVTILRILTGKSHVGIVNKVRKEYEGKSFMEMVDSTAGTWPYDVAEYLTRISLRCCKPEGSSISKLMMEMSSDLKNILDKIDS